MSVNYGVRRNPPAATGTLLRHGTEVQRHRWSPLDCLSSKNLWLARLIRPLLYRSSGANLNSAVNLPGCLYASASGFDRDGNLSRRRDQGESWPF